MARRRESPASDLLLLSGALSGLLAESKRADLLRAVHLACEDFSKENLSPVFTEKVDRVAGLYVNQSSETVAFRHLHFPNAEALLPVFLRSSVIDELAALFEDAESRHRILFVTGISDSLFRGRRYWTRGCETTFRATREFIEDTVCRYDRGRGVTNLIIV